jgi:hypothetical protein
LTFFGSLFVGPPQGTGTLTVLGFKFYLAIQSKGVVREVILRGSATPGRKPPFAPPGVVKEVMLSESATPGRNSSFTPRGVVKEVMLRGSATPDQKKPRSLQYNYDKDRIKIK